MQPTAEILNPETTYHLYNRANGSERLFLSAENYRYFMQKYLEYVEPIAETFCYCLMPNHFHFLIRIKPEAELMQFFGASARQNLQGFKNLEGLTPALLPDLLSKQFSNFFNAYSKAFNKMHRRKGSLFMHPFKRKKIDTANYLRQLVRYIHHNPIQAGLCLQAEGWPYSSFATLVNKRPSFLNQQEIISWFDDLPKFLHFHRTAQKANQFIHLA